MTHFVFDILNYLAHRVICNPITEWAVKQSVSDDILEVWGHVDMTHMII